MLTNHTIGAAWAAAACLIALQGVGKAQSRPKPVAASPTGKFYVGQFDATRASLEPLFLGTPAPSLYAALNAKASQFTKSDFETSSGFADRVATFSSTPVFQGMRPSDSFAFVVTPVTSYDADSEKLTVRADVAGSKGFEWSKSTSTAGTYVGSNSFGVKRKIRRFLQTYYEIEVDSPDWFQAYYSPNDALGMHNEFTLSVENQAARRLSRTLRVLLIGSLALPFIEQEQSRGEPTISDPVDLLTVQRRIYVALSAVWLFDGISGEVVKRYDRQQMERDWPIRIEVTAKNRSDLVSLHILTDGQAPKTTPYTTGEHAYYTAKSSMVLKLDFVHAGEPPIAVKMNQHEQQWNCKRRYASSDYQDCSIELSAP